ncbi:TetR/AcrR family transcriptional regulator [Pseudomonas veronii]|uniref:TetR/AcrR family transcriptional regulator n=5 Tax=Pseudomonas TaxID=286 RepID=A0A7Y1A8H0_PSEVE|nr:Transcriptional regulator, TetR family [Pseudomonas ogarae]MBI6555415.1 TetR/AcrR family transcriptional regulator [Pseudomonas veronii]MCF4992860.1 TetR family transcriptional regulator [Pseudomonas gessardii]PMU92547.1 TetR/AcrR family transcriptional regulator [Pseudomonas sp. GW704-F3]PMU95670.1 TetR/AcrR family transcriptional regulator [Pseudomonas sp. GW704-F5]PMV06884.1 TetR/AcrR family transcriptional regulator [Pseudomonas sp. MPBD4-3]PMV33945.1 TetR/AcrR family transcriptional r
MTDSQAPASPRYKRRPQQMRGHERVEMILDACARLMVGKGVLSLTMHGIAKEAGTSIGSLYHFFRDKEEVLSALGRRHIDALGKIASELLLIEPATWIGFSTADTVKHLVLPLLEYVEKNPDFLHMISPNFSAGQLQASDLQVQLKEIYSHVVMLRIPNVSTEMCEVYAVAMLALPAGLCRAAFENDNFKSLLILNEAPRALVAYLEAIEKQGA